jgi:serine/threonine protein kinase
LEIFPDQELGKGSFGSVTKGVWNGQPVAVKQLDKVTIKTDARAYKSICTDIEKEAIVIDHINIIKVSA